MNKSKAKNMEITEDDDKDSKDSRVYEIGFHLVPSLAEEEVAEEVNSIKKTIEEFGGIFLTEGYPKMQALEYTIEVPITMPKTRFNHSMFGWIKFEADGEASLSIREKLAQNKNIIRTLIVKTVKENTLYGYKLKQKKEAEERKEEEMKKSPEEKKVSDEEIDKSIEEIIV